MLEKIKGTALWEELKQILFIDTEFVGIKKNYSEFSKEQKKAIEHKWMTDRINPEYPTLLEQKKVTPSKYWKEKAGLTDFTKIVCFSFGWINDLDQFQVESFTAANKGEAEEMMSKVVRSISKKQFRSICAHHVGADLRAIMKECIRLEIPAPIKVSMNVNTAPWNLNKRRGAIYCTNALASTFFGRYTRLVDLCTIFGVDSPKDGIDGSKVHTTYWNGGIEKIREYCEKDVVALFHCFIRLIPYLHG